VSTWEERMAARAKAKGWAGPKTIADSQHHGHTVHHHGNAAICSCGEFMGIFSVALSTETARSDEPQFCEVCGVEL